MHNDFMRYVAGLSRYEIQTLILDYADFVKTLDPHDAPRVFGVRLAVGVECLLQRLRRLNPPVEVDVRTRTGHACVDCNSDRYPCDCPPAVRGWGPGDIVPVWADPLHNDHLIGEAEIIHFHMDGGNHFNVWLVRYLRDGHESYALIKDPERTN